MIIIEKFGVTNYGNVKAATLENLKDLNILIGPNNCGKTNILNSINLLSQLGLGGYEYHCPQCNAAKDKIGNINAVISLSHDVTYLRKGKVELSFLLNRSEIDNIVPGALEKQEKLLAETDADYRDELILKSKGNLLYGEHISIFTHKDIVEELQKSILFCPEGRLQSYRGADFKRYIGGKKFTGAEARRWIKFLKDSVDPKIDDHKYEDLIRKVDGEDFVTTIEEQGSGVRSLVCLAADILFEKEVKIVLIDEPELGLNPFAKQEFLKFLLNKSETKQIFIATQDPTFVNPILWKNNKVGVYFYSLINEEFVKIDLNQSKEDPNTFAGYLPHTVSLKDIHIYVEGTSDAYIFQVLLEKYLKQNSKNWIEAMNRVGIYHLCGGFWSHLLYTIPKPPYKCIVILDGDKRDEAKKICDKHNEAAVNVSKFKFCKDVKGLKKFFSEGAHPIYCLKEDCIEKYLFSEFDCSKLPSSYNKKVEGPRKAEEIEIPEEIKEIFEIIFKEA